jgi:hypothetical protein
MSYNISDINKLKSQIKQYYSFIKNDGMILTNFAKYLLAKTDMNLEQAIINLKDMSIKDIQTKLYDLTLELNTQTEISDIIKNKIDEENKKLKDVYSKVVEYVDLHKKYKIAIDNQINKTKKLEEEYKSLEDTELKKINDYKEYHKLLKDTSEKELITIKDTIDGIYKNEIYDNEYTFEESKYIIKEPMIYLKDSFTNGSIDLNFPIINKLQDNEYIIKYYILSPFNNKNDKNNGWSYLESFSIRLNFFKYVYCVYITNYGRILKSDIAEFYIGEEQNSSMSNNISYYHQICLKPTKNICNNKYSYYSVTIGKYVNNWNASYEQLNTINDCNYNIEYNLVQQPKLNYRIPRLFIDVIDAFHTQNTDLMQECCKKYLEISRESKIKDSILKDLELNNKLKEKDDIIKSKDLELEDKNKVIQSQQEEINKLKDELTKFKQSLSILINK